MEAVIEQIRALERDQAQLLNESARLAKEIALITRKREAAARTALFKEKKQTVELEKLREDLRSWRERLGNMTNELAALDEQIATCDEIQNALDKEVLARGSDYEPMARHEFVARRQAAIEELNHRRKLRHQLATELEGFQERYRDVERTMETGLAAAEAFAENARAEQTVFAEELDRREARKATIERNLKQLDDAKGNHFLLAGRCLADAGLAPMNQPQALEKVLKLRARIAETQSGL